MSTRKTFLRRLFTSQWSFLYAGIAFGLAQIIYMLAIWLYKSENGKTASLSPISVTTDLGRMFRSLEVGINKLFGFHTELYGNYRTAMVDGVESMIPGGGVFTPGIGWPIVGMILGGYLVSRMEKESRSWAYYSKKALIVSFLGGALFSYGTRLAGGCTLTHLMGGIPTMGIRSTFTVIFMAMGGALGFYIMEKLGLANYFKHQETKAYVANADAGEQATLRKGYNPKKSIIYWIGVVFALAFIGISLYAALTNAVDFQHVSAKGTFFAFGKSIDGRGVLFIVLTLFAGTLAGIGLGKSGFGTECSLVSLETATSMTKNDSKYAKMGVPRITRTLMRSYTPMIGVVTSWVVLLSFMLLTWTLFGVSPELAPGVKSGLTAGNFIGGIFLGIGAVTLIGCEIRSYMRIGMGYLNTLVGFIGFAVGYLPYTLFYKGHKSFLENTVIFGQGGLLSDEVEWYALLSDDPGMQKFILFLWLEIIIIFLIWLIRKGSKNTGLKTADLIHKNTEDIQVDIDEIAAENDGWVNGVLAPKNVPDGYYANINSTLD